VLFGVVDQALYRCGGQLIAAGGKNEETTVLAVDPLDEAGCAIAARVLELRAQTRRFQQPRGQLPAVIGLSSRRATA